MTPFATPVTESHAQLVDAGALTDAINASFEEFEDILGAVVTGLNPRGTWSANGSFPADAVRGDFWIVDRAGVVDGQAFALGDWLIALENSASPIVYGGNWARGDYSRISHRTYADAAALLASLEGPRGEGADWRAEPYGYREASPEATDHHLVTAGGQKLYVLPDSDGAYNLAAWGADLTGATPEHGTLQAVLDLGSRAVTAPKGATIRLGANITLRSNLVLDLEGVTLVSDGPTRSINVKGTATGLSSTLNNNGQKSNFGARPTTKGMFVAGDWAVLVNSPDVDNDGGPKGQASQLFRVTVVDGTAVGYDQLTFDQALGHHFTALNVTTPAALYKVVPIENVHVRVGKLQGVVVSPRLVNGFAFECQDADNSGAVQTDATVPSASRRGRIRANVTGSYAVSTGPNALVDLRGFEDLEVDIRTFGGREDGTRLYHCLNARGFIKSDSHGSRGVAMYKVSGERLRVIAENGTASGNVEQILADHCEDLDLSPRAVGFVSANGVEVRGRARRVTLREPHVVSRAGSEVQACINLHPAGTSGAATYDVRVVGGYVKGYSGYGIFAPDGCAKLEIDGTIIEQWGGGVWNPLTVSTDQSIAPPRNVLVQNVIADGHIAFGCTSSLRGQNLRLRNNVMSVPSGASFQLANYWDGVMLEDLRIESAPARIELRILNSTNVSVSKVKRPDHRVRWNFGGSTLTSFDDPKSEDVPALEVALAVSARIFDSFTDPDGTPITSHLPDAGPVWSETLGPEATVVRDTLRVTTDGNMVTQRFPTDAFVADLAIIRPGDGAWVDYSLVWDYVDASNFSEVRFTPSDGIIEIGDMIGGTRTARASFDRWDIAAEETGSVRVEVRGHRVALSVSDARVLLGTVNRATGAATGGWRRNGAATDAPVLASILVRD